METALKSEFLTSAEYLSGEELSSTRHEYVAGIVYAMAGGSDAHNTIALNLVERLRPRLRSGPRNLYAFDIKVRLNIANEDIFYYPDLLVTCDPKDLDKSFKEFPALVIEVLSESTERIDRHEKFWNYIQAGSLQEYVLIAQDRMEATVFRRSSGWKPEVLSKPDQELRLDSVRFAMRLEAVYEGVPF